MMTENKLPSPSFIAWLIPLGLSLLATLLFAASARAATASWSLTPPTYDFGAVAMGARSTPATFTLTNTGEADLLAPRVDLEFERPEDREGQESEIFEDSFGDDLFDALVLLRFRQGDSLSSFSGATDQGTLEIEAQEFHKYLKYFGL